ncbi:MAG: hypothetical protein NTU80_13865 [Verrucomicrobia bacterium]|nr:hypothetical protein [Verrucomicrobiota bacterium]
MSIISSVRLVLTLILTFAFNFAAYAYTAASNDASLTAAYAGKNSLGQHLMKIKLSRPPAFTGESVDLSSQVTITFYKAAPGNTGTYESEIVNLSYNDISVKSLYSGLKVVLPLVTQKTINKYADRGMQPIKLQYTVSMTEDAVRPTQTIFIKKASKFTVTVKINVLGTCRACTISNWILKKNDAS